MTKMIKLKCRVSFKTRNSLKLNGNKSGTKRILKNARKHMITKTNIKLRGLIPKFKIMKTKFTSKL